MGGCASGQGLSEAAILAQLLQHTKYTRDEIIVLRAVFKKMARKALGKEFIVRDQLLAYLQLSEFKDCLFADRLFKVIDANRDNQVDFIEFCLGLSAILKGNFQDKIAFLFKMYDLDGKGVVTKDNIIELLGAFFRAAHTQPKIMGAPTPQSTQARQIVERAEKENAQMLQRAIQEVLAETAAQAIHAFDKDKDGTLDYKEFRSWLETQRGPLRFLGFAS
eukprot:GILJ01001415.1.p1 GENE.GILJ01001415.1~~GILJ01001415.1.p1  ORF type:complete len:220 (+),score=36.33 GILJ01001415.1:44-703(+)